MATDGRFNDIIRFHDLANFNELPSFRVATRTQVITSYRNMHRCLVMLRGGNYNDRLGQGEFSMILLTLLICMAHSEPSSHTSYNHTFNVQLNGVDCLVKFKDLIDTIIVTPFQFMNAHAETIYRVGKSKGIMFEFGRLHGMEPIAGVGFIGFPYSKCDVSNHIRAYDKMVRENEHIRRYYFDCRLW